jgi:SAM-dependent methyltransferase
MSLARMVMRRFYRQAAGDPKRLPWHRDHPGQVLTSAVSAHEGRGRALDVGCGAGVFSLWLAERGMQVTGIDLIPEAIAMGRAQRARASNRLPSLELMVADLFTYQPDRPFDLVLDSGCLHSLVGGDLASYRRQLLRWLAPGGHYVLEHWGKRHALDWRPIGPRRRSPAAIQRLFAPELTLVESDVTDFAAPFPFGPTVRGVGYRFQRR